MKFMILVKATRDSEAGKMPSESLISEMVGFHEEMAKAGVLVDGLGWTPFFFFTFVIALPGIAMLWWQRPRIEALDHSPR